MAKYSTEQLSAITAFADRAQEAAAARGYGHEAKSILDQLLVEFDVHPAAMVARQYANSVIRGINVNETDDLEALGVKLLDAAFRAGYDYCNNG